MVCLAHIYNTMRKVPFCMHFGRSISRASPSMCLLSKVSQLGEVPCNLVSSGVVTYRAVRKGPNPSTSSGLGTMARGIRSASPVGCVLPCPRPLRLC
jgi:hypothetical protein